jgi:hypothetical protein
MLLISSRLHKNKKPRLLFPPRHLNSPWPCRFHEYILEAAVCSGSEFMHWHTKRILFKSISAFLKMLCLALPVGMLLAGTAQAQSSADGVTGSDWIHFPARPAKKNLPSAPTTATATTPPPVAPLSAPAQNATPKSAPAETSTQKPAAPPTVAGDWVQFPPLPLTRPEGLHVTAV